MKKLFLLFSILTSPLAIKAQGSVEAMLSYNNPSASYISAISSGAKTTIGWSFQTLTDINVTALGAFSYVLQNPGSIQIGLWDSSGNLLASNMVSITSTSDERVYQSITPLMLLAGQTYFLGACASAPPYFYVVGPDAYPQSSATMSADILLNGFAYNTNSFLAFPSNTEGSSPGDAIIAPNFQFQVVPEPSVFWLLGGGAIIFTFVRRRIKSPTTGA